MKIFTLITFLFFSILSVNAQDYLINFSGAGESTTIETVTVENLTQGKSITLSGSKTLRLMGTVTANTPLLEYIDYPLIVYPNPSSGDLTIQFEVKKTGMVNVVLFDIIGREINRIQQKVQNGFQSFKVEGLSNGIYTVQILLEDQIFSKKVICNSKSTTKAKITYNGLSEVEQSITTLKSANSEQSWQYNKGDRLKFQGTSGKYSTIVMDVPTQSKTLSFNFVECTDADGNNYPVVQIGNQLWMAENLKTTKYKDGSQILNETDNLKWANLTNGAYCWYNNDINNKTTYGALYNWFAVGTGKLAPTGWHVPTNDEWSEFITLMGGEKEAGEKTKETGTNHWSSSNLGATNEFGFTALPAGSRVIHYQDPIPSNFGGLGFNVDWWAISQFDNLNSLYTRVSSYDSGFWGGYMEKQNGYSVRCILGNIPTLNTTSVTNVTYGTADSGGSIINDGGLPITARGICWSTHQTPTIFDNKTNDSTGKGIFQSSISNLYFGKKYYLRAYAINKLGVGYGNELSFETPNATVSKIIVKIDSSIVVMGSSIIARAEAFDQDGKLISNIGGNWSSSDTKIADINQDGKITTEYDGEAYIKLIYEGKKDSIKLIVKPDFNNWKAFFEPVPNAFPNLNSYFKETLNTACLVVLARLDLNKDGRTDLVIHLWHRRSPAENLTMFPNDPVTNRLIALVAQKDGTLKDQTSEIFGSSIVDLAGGASRKVRVADLNKDGYPDLVYALNREDNRPNTGQTGANRSVAILSNGDGTYRTEIFGDNVYHHSVEILPMPDGSNHILLDGDEEYSFSNGNFVKTITCPARSIGTYIAYSTIKYSPADFFLSEINQDDYKNPGYLGLFKRNSSSNWIQESFFMWPTYRRIDFISYNGDVGTSNVFNYQGREYISGGFTESVALRLYPNTSPIPIVLFSTSYLPDGMQGKTPINENDCLPWRKLMAFESSNGSLQEINIISDPEGPYDICFMDAKDVNKDGYDDLITYPFIDGARPRVYLNNQSGKLNLLNSNKLPMASVSAIYNSAFADIDGDGIEDLIVFPGNGYSGDPSTTKFLLYKGRRNLQ